MKLYNIKIKTLDSIKFPKHFSIKIKKKKKTIKIDSKIRYHNFGFGERVRWGRVVEYKERGFGGGDPGVARCPLKVGFAASIYY